MIMLKKGIMALVVVASSVVSVSNLQAAVTTKGLMQVTRVKAAVVGQGGCTITFSKIPASGCPKMATAACDGSGSTPKDLAFGVFDHATMAFALNKIVVVSTENDPGQKIDGLCVVKGIEVTATPAP
jgi:hypothetical protein